MVHALVCRQVASVVDDDFTGKLSDELLHGNDQIRCHEKADRPSHRCNSLRQCPDLIQFGRTAAAVEIKAKAFDSHIVHLAQLFIGHCIVDDHDSAGILFSHCLQGVQCAAVIQRVGRRLNNDVPCSTELLLQKPVAGYVSRGLVSYIFRTIRETYRIVDVMVAVTRPGGDLVGRVISSCAIRYLNSDCAHAVLLLLSWCLCFGFVS